jgi:Ferredoxin-like domain in Api92-like protein
MPNWCENDLTVIGELDELKKFMEAVKGEEKDYEDNIVPLVLDFNKIVPMPEELRNTSSPGTKDKETQAKRAANLQKYGAADWYDWCIANWDTKWNASEPTADEIYPYDYDRTGQSVVEYHFNTAWSPPVAIIFAAAKKFPKLCFELSYFEGGMGYQGRRIYEKGNLVTEFDKKYSGHRGG